MIERDCPTELARALSRPDLNELRRALTGYFAWHQVHQRDPDEASERDDLYIDPIIHDRSDPDVNLALVALTEAEYDDPMFLGLVAAGPLEDTLMLSPDQVGLASHSDELFQRVMHEAKRNPRVRWMLGGIYTNSLSPEQQEEFDRIVGKVDWDALPPRPHAGEH